MSFRGKEAPMDYELASPLTGLDGRQRSKNLWLGTTLSIAASTPNSPHSPLTPSSQLVAYPSTPSSLVQSKQQTIAGDLLSNSTSPDSVFTFRGKTSKETSPLVTSLEASFKKHLEVSKEDKPKRTSHFLPRKRKKSSYERSSSVESRSRETRKSDTHSRTKFTVDHDNHLSLLYVIGGYMQLFFSLFMIALVLFVVFKIIMTVQHDLELKAEEYSKEIMYQVSECSKLYIQNKCTPSERLPAMEKLCTEWDICMSRDPKEVGRLKVGAETLAEILNKLIDPLSYKTMIFGGVLLFGSLLLTTTAIGLIKSKNVPLPPPPTTIHYYPRTKSFEKNVSLIQSMRKSDSGFLERASDEE